MLDETSRPITKKRFADFKNTVKIYNHVFKTPSSLRHYVFYAESNGLKAVISRLGKKLVFDLDKLDLWLTNGMGVQNDR